MSQVDKQAAEILAGAMEIEKEGEKFYQEFAKKTKNHMGQEMFAFLAREELKHLAVIKAAKEALEKGGKLSAGQKVDTKNLSKFKQGFFAAAGKGAKEKFEKDADTVKAIKAALEFEKRGYEYYKKHHQKTEVALVKGILGQLMAAEEEHYEILENTLTYLEQPRTWFDKKEGVRMDG
jgi:rubrerythrin